MQRPVLKTQEPPYDHPDSCHFFRPSPNKPFVATPGAIEMYTGETIIACLQLLQEQADKHNGIDYLQVFEDPDKPEALWFIEDAAITALLPSEY